MKFTKCATIFLMMMMVYSLLAQMRPDFEWEFYGDFGFINDFVLQDSIIWIATDMGLIEYYYLSDTRKFYQSNNCPIPLNEIKIIYPESRSRLWLGGIEYIYLKEQDSWTIFNKTDMGLSNQYDFGITSIAKDSSGNMWFAINESCVLKYDGQTWSVYDYQNSPFQYQIQKIVVQSDGTAWFLEFGGDQLYSYINDQFHVYLSDSIGLEWISDIEVDPSGRLWVVGDTVYTYNPDISGWERQDINYWKDNIYRCAKISFDTSGTIWYWLESAGLFRDDGITRDSLGAPETGILYGDIYNLQVGNDYQIWYSQWDQLYRYDYMQDTIYSQSFYKGIPEKYMSHIMENPDGTIWFNIGEKMYSFDGSQFSPISLDPLYDLFGVTSFYIQDMAVDSKNTKWLVVEDTIVQFKGNQFTKIDLSSLQLASASVKQIAIDSLDRLWAIASDLISFDGNKWERHNVNMNFNSLRFMETGPNNEVWFFKGTTLYKYYNGVLNSYPYGDPLTMCVDRKGRVWLAEEDAGVDMFDGTNWHNYDACYEIVATGASYDTTVWVGCYYGNISHIIDGNWWSYFFEDDFGFSTSSQPDIIMSDSKHNIWISFYDFGLIRLKELPAVSIRENTENISEGIILQQNYPNPFNPGTHIKFILRKSGKTRLTIYNSLGQKVRTLINDFLAPGEHAIQWDGKDERGNPVPTGIYIYELEQGEWSAHKKMILMR